MAKFTVREAITQDADRIASLLKALGYPNTPAFAQRKIERLSQSVSDVVLLAEGDGGVVGVAHLHLAELFHKRGRLGRVMALVVADEVRRSGVGRLLMSSLEALARNAGCVKLEVTSGASRHGAHAFYRRLGYTEEPKRFVKRLKHLSPSARSFGREQLENLWPLESEREAGDKREEEEL